MKKKYENKVWLKKKYSLEKLTITEISKLCKCGSTTIYRRLIKFNIKVRSSRFKTNHATWNKGLKGIHLSPETEFKKGENLREKNTHWKGGMTESNGYIYIYRPDHPYCEGKGYVLRSHLIAEKALGRYLKKNEMVHHINGNKKDDRNSNFLICTKPYHNWLHGKIRKLRRKNETFNRSKASVGIF